LNGWRSSRWLMRCVRGCWVSAGSIGWVCSPLLHEAAPCVFIMGRSPCHADSAYMGKVAWLRRLKADAVYTTPHCHNDTVYHTIMRLEIADMVCPFTINIRVGVQWSLQGLLMYVAQGVRLNSDWCACAIVSGHSPNWQERLGINWPKRIHVCEMPQKSSVPSVLM
jgi:hypothetical protein